jgi:hypothetical protein
MAAAVAPAAPVDDGIVYVCRLCDGRFGIQQMSKSRRRGRWDVYKLCLRCRRTQKRKHERLRAITPRSPAGELVEWVIAPDPWPCRLLAECLREDRDRFGFPFALAWAEDLKFVLARIRAPNQKRAWRVALTATRSGWEAAWHNAPGPGLGLDHVFATDLAAQRVVLAGPQTEPPS